MTLADRPSRSNVWAVLVCPPKRSDGARKVLERSGKPNATFGIPRKTLGKPWEAPGRFREACWASVDAPGRSWNTLGNPWEISGSLWISLDAMEAVGRSWEVFEISWEVFWMVSEVQSVAYRRRGTGAGTGYFAKPARTWAKER